MFVNDTCSECQVLDVVEKIEEQIGECVLLPYGFTLLEFGEHIKFEMEVLKQIVQT